MWFCGSGVQTAIYLFTFPLIKTKEKQFVFLACILVKRIHSSLCLNLPPTSLPQPRHLLGGISVTLAHPGRAQQVCTLIICSPHTIHSSDGCQETFEEKGAITLLLHKIFERFFAKRMEFLSMSPSLPTSLNPVPTTSNWCLTHSTVYMPQTYLVSCVWWWWFCWKHSPHSCYLAGKIFHLQEPY